MPPDLFRIKANLSNRRRSFWWERRTSHVDGTAIGETQQMAAAVVVLSPGSRPILSCHYNRKLWRRRKPWAYVNTVGPGQEFVFDADGIPEAESWLRSLFDT